MNLKESFRYQKFLDSLMQNARISVQAREHALKVTRNHLRSKTNPEAADLVEEVEVLEKYFPNDKVIEFMQFLVCEKDKLSGAIGEAKRNAGFDIDAAIEVNKFNRNMAESLKSMLRFTGYKRTEQGRDFKFDINGAQVPYIYDMEVTAEEAFDRENAKKIMRSAIAEADDISARIDAAMINIQVAYEAPFNVNDSFDDVMTEFTGTVS